MLLSGQTGAASSRPSSSAAAEALSQRLSLPGWMSLLRTLQLLGENTGLTEHAAHLSFSWSRMVVTGEPMSLYGGGGGGSRAVSPRRSPSPLRAAVPVALPFSFFSSFPPEGAAASAALHYSLSFTDFLEAMARLADIVSPPPRDEVAILLRTALDVPEDDEQARLHPWHTYFSRVPDAKARKLRRPSAGVGTARGEPLAEKITGFMVRAATCVFCPGGGERQLHAASPADTPPCPPLCYFPFLPSFLCTSQDHVACQANQLLQLRPCDGRREEGADGLEGEGADSSGQAPKREALVSVPEAEAESLLDRTEP